MTHLPALACMPFFAFARLALIPVLLTMGQAANAQDDGWTLKPTARAEISVISAETATRDDQIVVDGDALTVRGQVGLNFGDEDTRFRVEADRIEVLRLDEGRSNTNRDRITASVEQDFGSDWGVQLRGRFYDDFATAEASDTDEIQGSIRVEYEPVRAHRFRLRGSWREREYDNGSDPQTTGDGPRFDLGYRHRLGRYKYINFDLRNESITSDDPRRGYSRQSAKAAYTHPIAPDLRVRPALEYLSTRFDGRLTPSGQRRKDRLIVPEVELLWWPDKWRVEAEAKYIKSNSNELTRQREGYRLTLSVGYVF